MTSHMTFDEVVLVCQYADNYNYPVLCGYNNYPVVKSTIYTQYT